MTNSPLPQDIQDKLFKSATAAKDTAYVPYSKFRVGAALLTEDGTIFKGCNVENASYGGAICAERTAYVKAVSEGHTKFKGLTVTTDQDDHVSPCGICRQFISEFGPASLPVYLVNAKGETLALTLGDLLPYSFALEQGQKYLM
ncbi:cytidine deaminase [Zychaea mexicana]|uniref:cytidine deaminase n=1 Tax=Zychaea mexicana TaxID=64656 RepID=UPI0022FEF83E|nr:cytidine deaminase [Zychaea mexicana]KAI9485034.1 cytidine deaminase [Zychaea mexicana]